MLETERSSLLLSRSPSVRGNHNNQHQGSPEAEVRKTSAVGKTPWSRGNAEEGREAIWRPESSFPAFLPWPSSTGHSGQRQWQWLETGVQTSHRTRGQRSSVERSGEPVFITAVIYHGTKNKTHTPRRFTQVAIFITLRVNSLCLNLLNVFIRKRQCFTSGLAHLSSFISGRLSYFLTARAAVIHRLHIPHEPTSILIK